MAKSKLSAIVYIDGINFYYGQVKDSLHKWLDLTKPFNTVLGEGSKLVKIENFTARVQPAERDQHDNIRHNTCFRAFETHFGPFLRHKVLDENPNPPPNKIEIFKAEERGSDISLALYVLKDTCANAYDCAVIVSDDLDLVAALKLVQGKYKKAIEPITPGVPKRNPSWRL